MSGQWGKTLYAREANQRFNTKIAGSEVSLSGCDAHTILHYLTKRERVTDHGIYFHSSFFCPPPRDILMRQYKPCYSTRFPAPAPGKRGQNNLQTLNMGGKRGAQMALAKSAIPPHDFRCVVFLYNAGENLTHLRDLSEKPVPLHKGNSATHDHDRAKLCYTIYRV